MLNTKMKGLDVMSWKERSASWSSLAPSGPDSSSPRSSSSRAARAVSRTIGSVFLPRTSFSRRGICFSIVCMSARISSVLMVSMSEAGSTLPSTCTTSGSEKARVTWQIASASRMLARNWLPRPSPSEAPRTMPAMSTKDTVAGRMRWEPKISASLFRRGSGRGTTPTLGSMVAKG